MTTGPEHLAVVLRVEQGMFQAQRGGPYVPVDTWRAHYGPDVGPDATHPTMYFRDCPLEAAVAALEEAAELCAVSGGGQ